MINILLIEDDSDLALSIIDHLELENIICDYASNGIEGLSLIDKNSYKVIILDINMPGIDGLSVCQQMRMKGNSTPVIMLTARDTLENKLEGFRAGTDDYLVKPFEIEELIARIYSLSSRQSGQIKRINLGPISLNTLKKVGEVNGQPIKLTPTTFKILELLLRASPNPISQEELVMGVWGDDLPDSNKLRVHIHNLRKALNLNGAEHMLKTSTGYGFYIINDQDTLTSEK